MSAIDFRVVYCLSVKLQIKVMAYKQKEVVRPEPIVFRLNLPEPRRLIDCFLGCNTDV